MVNAALAGTTLVASFARFKASMAMPNEKSVLPLPCGRLDLFAMLEIRDSYEKAVQAAGCWEESGP